MLPLQLIWPRRYLVLGTDNGGAGDDDATEESDDAGGVCSKRGGNGLRVCVCAWREGASARCDASGRMAHRSVRARCGAVGVCIEFGARLMPCEVWAVVVAVMVPALVLCVVGARVWAGRPVAAVLLGVVSGSLWGVFAVLTKGLVDHLDRGLGAILAMPELYVWAVVAVAAVTVVAAHRNGKCSSGGSCCGGCWR